jgi:hypothetical protein
MADLIAKGGVYVHTQPAVLCKGHREWIWSVACSPNGLLCSGSQDKLVIAWNAVRHQQQQQRVHLRRKTFFFFFFFPFLLPFPSAI